MRAAAAGLFAIFADAVSSMAEESSIPTISYPASAGQADASQRSPPPSFLVVQFGPDVYRSCRGRPLSTRGPVKLSRTRQVLGHVGNVVTVDDRQMSERLQECMGPGELRLGRDPMESVAM